MNALPVSGSLAMIQPAWHHVSGSSDHRAGELYQTSLISALMAGLYEGQVTYGQMHQHGDFGVGTFNDLDGEMVGLDGTFYQLRSDGSVCPVSDDQKTPFAVVTFFAPQQELQVLRRMTKTDLLQEIEKATDANLFSAVRVDGMFEEVRTRTVQRQTKPFVPLAQVAQHQAERVFTHVEGTLAGFRSPAYAQGIGVAGFHLHFLRRDKQAGGHALDYHLLAGKVQTCTVTNLRLELPDSAEFLKNSLGEQALDEQIRAVEG